MQNPYNADRTAKICTRCQLMQPISRFHHSKTGRDGLRAYCVDCEREYQRAYRERNGPRKHDRERARINHAAWRAANPERYKTYQREYHRKWDAANPEKRAATRQRYADKRAQLAASR